MRTRSCIAALLLAASSAALPCRDVAAQEKDAVTEMAKHRFQEGVKFFDQKRYEEARAAFLQAYALKHHPAVLLNLAQCELRSGHNLEAARHFATYLREPPPNAGNGTSDAEKGVAAARAKLGRIQVSVAAGAEVLVDGEAVGQAPLPEAVDAAPGNHTVEARLAGHSTSTSVTVSVGKSATATLSLEGSSPAVAPLPPPPASNPPPPVAPTETPEGPPPSDTTNTSPATVDTNVQASSSGRTPFFPWLGHSGLGIAGVGLTVVGIGVFAGFSVAGGQAGDNADSVAAAITDEIAKEKTRSNVCADPVVPSFQKACTVLKEDIDKRDQDKTFATVGLVVAGVGVVTTVTAYLLTSKNSPSKAGEPPPKTASVTPGVSLVPVVGAHEHGLELIGRF